MRAIATWSRILRSDVTARLVLKDHKIEDPAFATGSLKSLRLME